jgi:hypothetical protein
LAESNETSGPYSKQRFKGRVLPVRLHFLTLEAGVQSQHNPYGFVMIEVAFPHPSSLRQYRAIGLTSQHVITASVLIWGFTTDPALRPNQSKEVNLMVLFVPVLSVV